MANITPKSNGTYLIRISCGSDAAGKPVSKSKIFKPSKPNLSYQKLNKEIDAFVKAFEEEIELYGIQKEGLGDFFPEIASRADGCRFAGCSHLTEPDCAVRKALEEGKISADRYENYRLFYEELKGRKKGVKRA